MIDKIPLEHILFLDIETVPEFENYSELDDEKKGLWDHKSKYQRKDEFTGEEFYRNAGIWAEFGKIVCISVGFFKPIGDNRNFRVTTFYGAEDKILKDFKNLLETHYNKPYQLLCAHNGKEFDFPYIARRYLINRIPLPDKLNLFGKKPWEIPYIDTMELWKFGDYKNFTSLKLLTKILDIPSPKDDIDGSMVKDVFYKEKDVDRIVVYCEKDVITIAQVLLRFKNEELLSETEITHV